MSSVSTSWAILQADPQAFSTLKWLAGNRPILPDISGDQVGTLLQVLQQLWQEQRVPEAQRVTAFSHTYQLLARWALGQFATATTPVDKTQLHEAVTGALRLLQSHGCTAQVSAACILFLGAASKGMAAHQREEAALAACSVLQAYKAELSKSPHTTELMAGVANIMISLQCHGSLVLWLLASVMSLWSPPAEPSQEQQQAPRQQYGETGGSSRDGSSSSSNSYDIVGQVMPVYSMMQQVGAAMLQRRGDCQEGILQMASLMSAATHSGHWQEGAAAAMAAGGLLEGLARGTAALAPSSPALQALCQVLTQACIASQPRLAVTEQAGGTGKLGVEPSVWQPQLAGCGAWRDVAAVACCQTWQACRLPPPSGPVVTCLMSCLWDSCLSLKGLFQASALKMDPQQGNAWLKSCCSSRLMQEAATMARITAELYKLVDEHSQQVCQEILQTGCRDLHEGYRGYASMTALPWMQAVDAAAVRQVLDKAFMSGVLLMTALWSVAAPKDQPAQSALPSKRPQASKLSATPNAAPATTATGCPATATAATSSHPAATATGPAASAAAAAAHLLPDATAAIGNVSGGLDAQQSSSSLIAVELLDSLSYLQFCRMKLTAYNTLLKNVLTAVSTDAQATQRLLEKLPCYEDLIGVSGDSLTNGGRSQAGTQQAVWASDTILATRVLLFISALGACLPALPKGNVSLQAAPLMFLYLQHSQKPLAAAAHSLFCAVLKQTEKKEELVPFYIKRALEGYPACTSITGLSAGVDAAMRELPSGSPVVLYTLHKLAQHASELLNASITLQQSSQAGLDLVRLLAQMLLVVEFQFLPDALDTAERVVVDCSSTDVQLLACSCIHEVLMTSDDYTRKVKCAQWYQHLAVRCADMSRQNVLPGAKGTGHWLLNDSPLP